MYVNQVVGFVYLGYVYQWDHKLGGFTPNGAIPFKYPLIFYKIPNAAINFKLSIWEEN